MSHIDTINAAAKRLRGQRDMLTDRATAMHKEIEQIKGIYLRGIKNSVAAVAQSQAELLAAIAEAPDLFDKPRSMVLHGIKLGFKKGTGSLDWEDDAQVAKLVRKHFPEQFDVLIKTTEKPIKGALASLTAAELKRVAVTVEDTGDVVFAKDTTAEVDKLVKALLKGAEDEVAA
jgi:hypothetical protein